MTIRYAYDKKASYFTCLIAMTASDALRHSVLLCGHWASASPFIRRNR